MLCAHTCTYAHAVSRTTFSAEEHPWKLPCPEGLSASPQLRGGQCGRLQGTPRASATVEGGRGQSAPPRNCAPPASPTYSCVHTYEHFLCVCDREKEAGDPGSEHRRREGAWVLRWEASESTRARQEAAGSKRGCGSRCHGLKGPWGPRTRCLGSGSQAASSCPSPGSSWWLPPGTHLGFMAPGWAVP